MADNGQKKQIYMKMVYMFLCFFVTAGDFCIASPKQQDDISSASTGPTVTLKADKEKTLKDSTSEFMYFVPLISPTTVYSEMSKDYEQKSGLISCVRKSTSNSFYVIGEFQMQGRGFYKSNFDTTEMIARNTKDLKNGSPLKHILGYIKFDGEGYGWIEITGEIDGGKAVTTEVRVHFNGRGGQSPVTAGLYSVKPVNGEYKYSNHYNEIVARVDSLTFNKSTVNPLMDIVVSSIYAEGDMSSFWGNLKGSLANLFIQPLEIDKLGNDTMLDFGLALFKGEDTFTFPEAKNLRENGMSQSAKTLYDK
jgi:hypothetical protein